MALSFCLSGNLLRRIFVCFLIAVSLPLWTLTAVSSAPSRSDSEAAFRTWLETDIWPQAQTNGVSRATFERAFKNVSLNWKLPDLVLPGTKPQTPKVQTQAEFSSPARYFNEKTVMGVVSGGKARRAKNGNILKSVEQRFGVPGAITLAIWGRESAFGTVKIPYDTFEVLGTKAFMATRKEMFRKELIAALIIVEKGYIDRNDMKSSWAGALGQPQFMPTSYLKHAIDTDGDGHRDIWHSVPDTLGSVASYLALEGWQRGRHWGYEIILPTGVSCALEGPDQGKSFAEWQKLGIKRADGKPFVAAETAEAGFLMLPAGRYGPAFLVTQNFYVLKAYNMSDLYALFIGHTGDRMTGAGPFKTPWQQTDTLYRSDVAAMQKKLQALGYDVGSADGLAGFKTRRSIGMFQEKNGMKPTCFPGKKIIEAIR